MPLLRGSLLSVVLSGITACAGGYWGPTDSADFGDDGKGYLVIYNATGGNIMRTTKNLEKMARSDVLIVVDGWCSSSCTLLLSERFDNVCWTDRARFRFHGASRPASHLGPAEESFNGTMKMWVALPRYVRDQLPPPKDWRSKTFYTLGADDLPAAKHCDADPRYLALRSG